MIAPHNAYLQGWTCSSEQQCQSTRPALKMHGHSTPSRLVFLCLLLSSFLASGCELLGGNIVLEFDEEPDATNMSLDANISFCGHNEHVLNNECVPCKPGTTNNSGNDPKGRDTSCHITPCAQNEYVLSHACVSCTPGSINKAGNDPTGEDTSCVPITCGVQERVQNNKCVACPEGSYNDMGGDDASGPNTSCHAILCAQDEHVQNHVCTPCPKNTSNVAQDDALGPDTFCKDRCGLIFGVSCAEFEEAYLKASNPDEYDYFGKTVAMDGDTLVVGAEYESSNAAGINQDQSNNNASSSGAVYVFIRDGSTWTQQAYLKASNSGKIDRFGGSVDIDGDTIVVGAHQESSNANVVDGNQANNKNINSGAAYVFTRTGSTWTQQAYLKASNSGAKDQFGLSVSVDGDTIVVSAPSEDSDATGVDGDQIDNTALGSGAVYVFTRTDTTWTQQAYLKASNAAASDRFGASVDIDEDTIVVSAPHEGVDGDPAHKGWNNGAAYVFARTGTIWEQQAYIKASNPEENDVFGASVAIDGDTIVVGAFREDSNATGINQEQTNNSAKDSGAVYVFVRTDTTWEQQAYIKASNSEKEDNFGASVAIYGDTIAVDATNESSSLTGFNPDQTDNSMASSGAVYLFTRTDSTWTQQAYLKASNTDRLDFFGSSVALAQDTLVVGAHREDSNAQGVNGDQRSNDTAMSGAVYIRRLAP